MIFFEACIHCSLILILKLFSRRANIVTVWSRMWAASLIDGAVDESKDWQRTVIQTIVLVSGIVMVVSIKTLLHVRGDRLIKLPKLR